MKPALIALKQFEQITSGWKKNNADFMPRQGWVRSVRKLLGMTIKQLAKRLGVDPSRVIKIEMSEREDAVTLRTLRAVAEQLGCTFVYGFVPKTSFEQLLKSQAEKIAKGQIARIAHSMDLESQHVSSQWREAQKKELIEEILRQPWKHLWEEEE